MLKEYPEESQEALGTGRKTTTKPSKPPKEDGFGTFFLNLIIMI